jgi:N-acetylmuramoyl-L-alanine amidase
MIDKNGMFIGNVYIDIGHGNKTENGRDMGAISKLNGIELVEYRVNVRYGYMLAMELALRSWNIMIEPGNLSLSESAAKANAWGADILISCHANAGGGD